MCHKCDPYGGLWQRTDGGMARCDCTAGAELAATDHARASKLKLPPVLNVTAAVAIVKMLSGNLRFVPSDPLAVSAIADQIRSMCESNEAAMWLVTRMGQLYQEWPGTRAMRVVYSSKHRPLDGVEVDGFLPEYPDGVPSEQQLEAPPRLALPPGGDGKESVSAAKSLNETVLFLAEAKSMRNIGRHVSVPDIPVLPPGKRITQADVDAALEKLREQRARGELGTELRRE
jgi:hypothetical protein